MAVTFTIGIRTCSPLPKAKDIKLPKSFRTQKIILVLLTFVFGIELGFKLASKQVLYLLNPCHVITIVQVSSAEHNEFLFYEMELVSMTRYEITPACLKCVMHIPPTCL